MSRKRTVYSGRSRDKAKYERAKKYFLRFLFDRKPYLMKSSKHIDGNYDPKRKKMGSLKFAIDIKLDQFFKSELVSDVMASKERLLKLAKKVDRSWTLSEPATFLTDDGQVDGLLVTEVTGKNLLDFWFENGQLNLKLMCYGIGE